MRRRSIAVVSTLVVALAATLLVAPAASAAPAVSRLAGSDRYETSVAVSQTMPTGGVVFLASGTAFPDALAAAPVAAAEHGRLLLVRQDELPGAVAAELRRIAPSEVVIVGADATISEGVAGAVRTAVPSTRLTRIAGGDRIETSMLLLDRMRETTTVTSVWVVSALKFPDALVAGAVAARRGQGIVLAGSSGQWFSEQLGPRLAGIGRVDVAGSADSVSPAVVDWLGSNGLPVARFDGVDRYHTALLINQRYSTGSTSSLVLASGENFPDGLAGSVFAGRTAAPMYLTPARCAPGDAVASEVRRLGVQRTIVLGGETTVSPAAAALVNCAELDSTAGELLTQVNAARAAAGLAPLRTDACLSTMAGGWAEEMAAGQLSGAAHNPNLTADARACELRGWGENVGRTGGSLPDADRMMTTWMNSPGHRANILRADMQYIGIGVEASRSGYWYYVLDFGRR